MTTTDLLLSAWRFDPIVVGACAIALAILSTRARPRRACVAAGFLALVVALASPVGELADGYLFSAHMLQHLLLLLVVPPLALLGLGTTGGEAEVEARGAAPSPLVPGAWLSGVAAMWVWHAPRLCNAATASAVLHLVQEISLLAMGAWFFWPVLAPRRADRLQPLAAIGYLFTACAACTLLGILVTFSPVEICSAYLFPTDRLGALPLLRDRWGLTPPRDQQIGGLLMWLPACLIHGAAIIGVLARWYGESDVEPTSSPRAEIGAAR